MPKTKNIKFNWSLEIKSSIKDFLEKQILNHQIAPSYLFYGPGPKDKMARTFAKIILCQSKKRPCQNQCCRIFEQGIHPDFIVLKKIKKDTQIKIERIREVIKNISMKTDRRVVLIKKAELLSIEAANAFLKTLEEPGKETVFILTASNVKQVIPTIISRCQGIYLSEKDEIAQNPDREKKIKEFLRADLIRRFRFAKEIAEMRGEGKKIINSLEMILRAEMLNETNFKERKSIAKEIKRVTGSRLLLKRNVSVRLILEDLSLTLKERD